MFSFNKIFLFMIALAVSGASFAQTTYESPHVKDGKTIQFTLPKGHFEVEGVGFSGVQMYTTKENKNFEELTEALDKMPVLAVLHLPANENSLESIMKMIKDQFSKNKVTEIEAPKLSKINGRDIIFAAAKGEIEGQKVDGMYFSAIAFGDYIIMVSYSAAERLDNVMKYKNFKKIISSWKEIETEKKDEFRESEDLLQRDTRIMYEDEEMEIEPGGRRYYDVPPAPSVPPSPRSVEQPKYENSMFKTKLEHSDVDGSIYNNWSKPILADARLLAQFVYQKNKGSVKVFSGGDAANYENTDQMALSIQLAIGKPGPLEINYTSQLSKEFHGFKMYTISGGEKSWFYTTEVDGELIFFVVDAVADSGSEFKKAVDRFMLLMHVENFED